MHPLSVQKILTKVSQILANQEVSQKVRSETAITLLNGIFQSYVHRFQNNPACFS